MDANRRSLESVERQSTFTEMPSQDGWYSPVNNVSVSNIGIPVASGGMVPTGGVVAPEEAARGVDVCRGIGLAAVFRLASGAPAAKLSMLLDMSHPAIICQSS